jgi:hypothetical protein
VSRFTKCPDSCGAGDKCVCSCELDFDALDDQTLHRAMHDTMFTLQFIFYQVGISCWWFGNDTMIRILRLK